MAALASEATFQVSVWPSTVAGVGLVVPAAYVSPAGNTSVTTRLVAVDGPLFVTVTV